MQSLAIYALTYCLRAHELKLFCDIDAWHVMPPLFTSAAFVLDVQGLQHL